MNKTRLLVLAVVAAFVFGAIPTANAQLTYGQILTTQSPDVVAVLETATHDTICYIDTSGNGRYDAGEPILLRTTCAGSSEVNDLRLSTVGGNTAGTKVRTGASDFNVPTRDAATDGGDVEMVFHDADGNSRFTPGDTAYICIRGTGTCTENVAVGWLRLTPFGNQAAGTYVQSGHPDLNLLTSDDWGAAEGFFHWDINGDGDFNADDVMYFVTGDTDGPAVNDIRLGPLQGTEGFGRLLTVDSVDVVARLIVTDGDPGAGGNDWEDEDFVDYVCYIDEDNDGSYTAGEPIIFVRDGTCDDSAVNDLRLSTHGNRAAGTKIPSGAADFNRELDDNFNDIALMVYDADGNGVFNSGDSLYLCLQRTGTCGNIAVGWLRLTTYGNQAAGTFVMGGHSDLNLGAVEIVDLDDNLLAAGLFGYWDLNGDGSFNADDVLYLHIMNGGATPDPFHPNVGVVRLGPLAGTNTYGTILTSGSRDVVPTLTNAGTFAPAACFVDLNNNARYDSGEPVYLAIQGCGVNNVRTHDVRLTAVGGLAAGSFVASGDSDHNHPILAFTADRARFVFHDADGSGSFNQGDTAYLCIRWTADDCDTLPNVAIGWVRITAFGNNAAGSYVQSGHPDLNLATDDFETAGGDFMYWDVNGDERFNLNDVLYLVTDAQTDYPGVNHIRVAGSAAATPTTPATPPTTPPTEEPPTTPPTEEPPVTPPTEEPPTQPPTTPPGDGDGDQEDTPAPAVLMVLAALGALLVAIRRRR